MRNSVTAITFDYSYVLSKMADSSETVTESGWNSRGAFRVSQVDTGHPAQRPKMGDNAANTSNSNGDHREMSELNRILSFNQWPVGAPVDGDVLARAGFYYTGEGLDVRCHMCHARRSNWHWGDDPFELHASLNPGCPFVVQASQSAPTVTTNTVTTGRSEELSGGPVSFESDSAGIQRYARRGLPEFRKAWPEMTASAFVCASQRLLTFTDWPVPFVSATDLAAAGFVYLRESDRVQCVFCHGEVMAWELGDVPEHEHRRHFPLCEWVRGTSPDIPIGSRPPTVPAGTCYQPLFRQGYDECGTSVAISTAHPSISLTMRGGGGSGQGGLADQSTEQLQAMNVIPHSQPQYPKFATREARQKSYKKWPVGGKQSVASLVEAGLFYVGSLDQVKCFHCGGGLQNWEAEDDPWEEHARWFPTCNFVNLNKGRDYVEKSKLHRPPVLPSQTEKQEPVNSGHSTPAPASQRISDSELDVLMNSDITKAVLETGVEPSVVLEVLRHRMDQVGYQFTNAELLANAVLEHCDQIPPKVEETTTTTRDVVLNNLTVVNVEMSGASNTQTTTKHSSGSSDESLRSSDQDLKLCKVCMDEEMNVVFLPCGHFMACTNCASAMTDCPICRRPIKGTVRTYWP